MASSGAGSVERDAMVNGTRLERNRTATAVLPDDLVREIFYRLPAKEVLRCGAACRSWRRLTRNAEFLLAHHHRQPSLPLVSFRPTNDGYTGNACVDAFDLRRTPAVSRSIIRFNDLSSCRSFFIHASCDGLILLSVAHAGFYICNSATRQSLALPALTGGYVAALYPHSLSGEYRVLYRKHLNEGTSESAVYYVLTVGSSEGQGRRIGVPVASPSLTIRVGQHPPALLHDCVHWYVNDKVVVFDTLAESFRWMESPIAANSAHLLQMDGTLCIGHTRIGRGAMIVELWVLQDYKRVVWSSKYRIGSPLKEMTEYFGEGLFFGQVVSGKGDVLVTVCLSMSSNALPWWSMFHYDCNGKLLERFQLKDGDPMVLGLCFKKSLVRHVFFQRKDSGHETVPRFFPKAS